MPQNTYQRSINWVNDFEEGRPVEPVMKGLSFSPVGTSWFQLSKKGTDFDKLSGWKMHLSVAPEDVPRAWDLVADYMAKSDIPAAKVATPRSAAGRGDPGNDNAGKMITIYDSGQPGWEKKISDIESLLKNEGIRPGPAVADDRPIAGSRYGFYREDGGDDYYRVKGEMRHLPQEQRYNPRGLPDPFKNADVSGLYAAGAERSADVQSTVPSKAELQGILKEKVQSGDLFSFSTTKGTGMGITGTVSELTRIEAGLKSQGIITSHDSLDNGGYLLRIKTESVGALAEHIPAQLQAQIHFRSIKFKPDKWPESSVAAAMRSSAHLFSDGQHVSEVERPGSGPDSPQAKVQR